MCVVCCVLCVSHNALIVLQHCHVDEAVIRCVTRLRRHRTNCTMTSKQRMAERFTQYTTPHTIRIIGMILLHCHVGGTVAALTDSAVIETNCTMPSNSVSAFVRLYDEPHIQFARARLFHQVCPSNIHGMSAIADTTHHCLGHSI